ncbi:MAG: 3-isopropylmalate dehydratase small subunit [Spirochaetaceae bacterium]|nr:3-isopropylmalate dehydratase small subunit [Spirochaetaceae bacterium]
MAAGRVWKYGDDVNTDVIFPGKYTYTLRSVDEIKAHALEDLDPDFARAVRPGDVICAGRTCGCGSSREQAVTCLVANGIAAVVAVSFARIFYRNCINNGLPAIVSPEAVAAIAGGENVEVLLEESVIRSGAARYRFPPFSQNVQRLLDAGGLIPFVRARLAR